MSNPNRPDAGSSMFYVVLVSAGLLGAAVFPFSFLIALRYLRLRHPSPSPGPALYPGGAPAVKGKPQQDEPMLFDVYIKPDLEVDEAKFGNILVSLGQLPSSCSADEN